MATSTPSYTLKEPNTINIINKILEFRKETCLPICYTLDAGPNVHLLYPDSCAEQVHKFIEEVLKDYCFENKYTTYNLKASIPKNLLKNIHKQFFDINVDNINDYKVYANLNSDIKK